MVVFFHCHIIVFGGVLYDLYVIPSRKGKDPLPNIFLRGKADWFESECMGVGYSLKELYPP